MSSLRLGVNVDHVATLRQARYATMPESKNAEPDLLVAARICERAGAGGIVAHLRSDRRHIQDHDIERLRQNIMTKLNLEMGNTEEIIDVALRIKPEEVCLVPEKREEITTEGGLDVMRSARNSSRPLDACKLPGFASVCSSIPRWNRWMSQPSSAWRWSSCIPAGLQTHLRKRSKSKNWNNCEQPRALHQNPICRSTLAMASITKTSRSSTKFHV